LSYVIRKEEYSDMAPPGEDGVEELVCLVPLHGTAYLEDKKRVYCIIRDVISRTDGWTWCKMSRMRMAGRPLSIYVITTMAPELRHVESKMQKNI